MIVYVAHKVILDIPLRSQPQLLIIRSPRGSVTLSVNVGNKVAPISIRSL